MIKTDAAVLIDLIGDMGNKIPPNDKPAYQMLGKYSEDYAKGINVFYLVSGACARIRELIELLPQASPAHLKSFRGSVKAFEKQFSISNVGTAWNNFLSAIQNPLYITTFQFIDYAISSQAFWSQRRIDKPEMESILADLEAAVKSLSIPEHVKKMIANDVARIKLVIENADRFGEQDYWKKYQEIVGLFATIYVTLDDDAKQQVSPLLERMLTKMTTGLSIAADSTQMLSIAVGVAGFLPRT